MIANFPRTSLILLIAAFFSFSFSVPARSQDPAPQPNAQPRSENDPIRQLNLTPEQQEKIRAITQDNRDERLKINRRLREAQVALEETLDSDSPSEAAVEERIRELTAAQAAQVRMRALTELKIRGVLTPEQLSTLRALRAERRNQRRNEQSLPNQRNGISPLFPGTRRNALPLRQTP